MIDRRQHPRHLVDGEYAGVQATLSVRVLDISVSGVLLHANRPVQVGERGSLRLSLGGRPFTADVEVHRVTAVSTGGSAYRIGLAFVGVTPEHGQLIERFVSA
jgi:hypothetical protein